MKEGWISIRDYDKYQRLRFKLTHYDQEYKFVDVPWIVPRNITRMTTDDSITPIELYETPTVKGYGGKSQGDLVGSAEQSFLHMMQTNQLDYGLYVAISPCFRNESHITKLTRPYFMKVELLWWETDTDDFHAKEMVEHARDFFLYESEKKIEKVKTNDGIDLYLNGVEIGSYGFRNVNGLKWAYGTGLAEPRFTEALKL